MFLGILAQNYSWHAGNTENIFKKEYQKKRDTILMQS